MFRRLSKDAKNTIVTAHRAARAAGADAIDTAHLLVGMTDDPSSPGGAVLADLGVRSTDLRDQISQPPDRHAGLDDDDREALAAIGIDLAEIERKIGKELANRPSPAAPVTRDGAGSRAPRMSQECKTAIAGAFQLAIAERTRTIRSDHLLLAIADASNSMGARLLADRGLRASDVHEATQRRRAA